MIPYLHQIPQHLLDGVLQLVSNLSQHPVVYPWLCVFNPFQTHSLREAFQRQFEHLLTGGSSPGVYAGQDKQVWLAEDLRGKGLHRVAEQSELDKKNSISHM